MNLSRPMIIALLYLFNFFLGFSVFVGVVLAYVWRGDEDTQEWEVSHFTYAIHSFWLSIGLGLLFLLLWIGGLIGTAPYEESEPAIGFLITMIAGILVWFVLMGWFCARTVISLARASNAKPMADLRTWLF